ncbi:MAG: glycosyltransferase family 2 protein [Bacteroidota bacterium]
MRSEKNLPLISVITAVYNCKNTIERTIISIITQNCTEFEYIIVDGGSTDGTLDILRKYQNRISILISEPDNGIYNAWNKGVKVASGEWICFIGSGDSLYPDTLLKYQRYILLNGGCMYISSKVNLQKNGNIVRVIGQPWIWPKFLRYMTVAHVGSMHHKSLFEQYGLFDESYKITGDYEFLLRPGKNLSAGFFPEITVEMELGGISNLSKSVFKETFRAKTETGKKSLLSAKIEDWVAKFKFYITN